MSQKLVGNNHYSSDLDQHKQIYVIKKLNGRRHSADYEGVADSEDPHTISDPELKQLYNSKKRHSHIIKVKRRES